MIDFFLLSLSRLNNQTYITPIQLQIVIIFVAGKMTDVTQNGDLTLLLSS